MKDKRTTRTDNNRIKLKHMLIIAVSLSLVVTLILFATDKKEQGIEPDGSSNELTSTCRIVYDKVKKANLSYKEIIELSLYLTSHGYSNEMINNFDELRKNEYGQTYGPDDLGADLISVLSDEGRYGYVYREDVERGYADSLEEAIEKSASCEDYIVTVYEADGRTPIGIFTFKNTKKER